MRVVVLALDGLDYRSAAWFPSLRQRHHGYVDITGIPLRTEALWASFITGAKPDVHGVYGGGMRARVRAGVPTLADVPRSVLLWVPGYNPHPLYWSERHTRLLIRSASDPSAAEEYKREIARLFTSQREEFMRHLKRLISGEIDLLMAHFNYYDALSHMLYVTESGKDMLRHLRVMRRYTVPLAKLAYDVRRVLPSDAALLIVSDHGAEHDPSNAFWSCSVALPLQGWPMERVHITQFYGAITSLIERY